MELLQSSLKRISVGLFLVTLLISCGGAEPFPTVDSTSTKFCFDQPVQGKRVDMIEVLGDSFTLSITDSTQIEYKIENTTFGQKIMAGNWEYEFEKAIKNKRYYYLLHEIDSSLYEVLVVGKYMNRYYGFDELGTQNYNVFAELSANDSTNEIINSLATMKVEGEVSDHFVVAPTDRKALRKYFKHYFSGNFLREYIPKFTDENTQEEDLNLSVDELELSEDIKVFPNPISNGELSIVSDLLRVEGTTVNVTDMKGVIVYSETVKGKKVVKVEVDGFKPGMYSVLIIGPTQKASGKFVVTP